MRVDEWIRMAGDALQASGFGGAATEARVLASHVLLRDRAWLLAHPYETFPELAGASLLERRLAGEPLSYIIGSREFFGRPFRVSPAVLIPRQDTETLVEVALLHHGGGVLDIGTGSGCLAVTLNLERPAWEVTGTDISAKALEVASDNARDLQADVRFVESDLFDELQGEMFDLIVSNPPYISPGDPEVAVDVAGWEPEGALYAGENGLQIYRRLAQEAKGHLRPSGQMLLEVGHTQAAVVASLFELAGWESIGTWKDLAGIDRVVGFTLPRG